MSENAQIDELEAGEHVPTEELRELVIELAKTKSERRVARQLGLTTREFMRHYGDDYETGREEAKEDVLAKLLAQGLAGNSNAAVKYLQMTGHAPPQRVEHTGKDGGPIEHVDLTRLSDDQLRTYGQLAAIAAGIDPDTIPDVGKLN